METYYITRQPSTDKGTFGAFKDDTGNKICLTCELPWRNNEPRVSCIPTGTYTAKQYNSPKHGLVWEITPVEGRSNIEMHPGNDINDLLGCIAVGSSMGTVDGLPAVLNSRATFAALRHVLPEEFTLIIENEK